jgi:hypothetical protein
MVAVIHITLGVLFILTAVTSCILAKRYKELRNYTFWVEQTLLQYRPETYVPQRQRRQRDKDTRQKGSSGRKSDTDLCDDRALNCQPEQAPPEPPKVPAHTA